MGRMKSLMSQRGIFVSLGCLVFVVGLFRYTLADIVFPNVFTSGTTASASQVNANFAAINTRQTASASSMAGTWNYVANGTITITGPSTCSISGAAGVITLSSNGTASITESGFVTCPTASPSAYTNTTVNGTWAVSANGSGTINITGGSVYSIQASKELNQMLIMVGTPAASGSVEVLTGTAIRQ